MKKLLGLAMGAALFATGASAAPATLTDSVMDGVTAGYKYYHSTNTAYSDASAFALALGKKTNASTYAYTHAIVTPYSSEASAYSSSYASTH